jgi:hypothetical protein
MTKTTSPVKKSERLHVLVDPKFKRYLNAEAKRTGLSVAELVRQRFEQQPTQDEALLAALTAELNRQVDLVSRATDRTIALADEVLAELRAAREKREAAADERGTAHEAGKRGGAIGVAA